MKIRIELDEGVGEEEIIIRCKELDENVQRIHRQLTEASAYHSEFVFYKKGEECYFPVRRVLFFETEGEGVYAHTKEDFYLVRLRLYELENLLPREFIRISKTTIVNLRYVYSVSRNISSASLLKFHQSHKQAYVSRLYYKGFKQRLDEVKAILPEWKR